MRVTHDPPFIEEERRLELLLEEGFTRDVRNIGHFGTGIWIRISSDEDLEKAEPLLLESYEAS